jgi:hypothetical protein
MARDPRPPGTEIIGQLTEDTGDVLAVSPPVDLAESLLVRLHDTALDVPTETTTDFDDVRPVGSETESDGRVVRLLLDESDIDRLFETFRSTALAADLIESGQLAIRTTDELGQRLTLTEETAYAHVTVGDQITSLDASTESFCSSLRTEYEAMWDDATAFDPGVPALSRLLSTFADSFPSAAETLAGVIGSDTEIERSGDFDPITVVGLVAARHELQTLEVSEWAEEIGLSSRTELSRVKSRLSNRDVVDTDRVPHGVGRPRQKLVVADETLSECPADSLLDEARTIYEADTRRDPGTAVSSSVGTDK